MSNLSQGAHVFLNTLEQTFVHISSVERSDRPVQFMIGLSLIALPGDSHAHLIL